MRRGTAHRTGHARSVGLRLGVAKAQGQAGSPTPRARRKRANGPRPRRAIPDPASFRQGQARAKGKAHPRRKGKVEGAAEVPPEGTKRETRKRRRREPPSGRHNAMKRHNPTAHSTHTVHVTRHTDPRRTAHAPGRGACAAAARAVAGRGGGTQSTEPRAGTHSRAAGTECREFRFSRERAREISSRQVGVCDVEHERGALRLAVLPDLVLE